MRLSAGEARQRFAAARVVRLATADAAGVPHLVPMVFALVGDTIYSAVDDAKPKATLRLARLRNIAANPAVALLADEYSDDWDALWWVRADGSGRILDASEPEARDAITRLAVRYSPYRARPPRGPVVAIDVARWSSWSAGGD